MGAEIHNEYFRNFTDKKTALPGISWQEMLAEHKYFGPNILRPFLQEARDFLTSEPGPNLERRQKTVPSWFDFWEEKLQMVSMMWGRGEEVVSVDRRSMPVEFDSLSEYLIGQVQYSGIIFVAGGEGHQGHLHVARHMKGTRVRSIWAFEQDKYNEDNKLRGGHFFL